MTIYDETQQSRSKAGEWGPKLHSHPELEPFIPKMDNYVSTTESETAIWYLDEAGNLHRTNGPAVERDGTHLDNHYYIHGKEIFAPDNTGYDLQSVDAYGTQLWVSGSGNRTVTVDHEGSQEFRRDGDMHRDGAPAVVDVHGRGRWFRNDSEIPSPWPKPADITRSKKADTVTTTGSRYVEGTDPKTIAKNLRVDIAYALTTGILDNDFGHVEFNVRVAKDRREDRPTIAVDVTGLTADRVIRDSDEGTDPFHTDEARTIIRTLTALGESYNRTTIHNGTDSIQSPFYFNVNIPTR